MKNGPVLDLQELPDIVRGTKRSQKKGTVSTGGIIVEED